MKCGNTTLNLGSKTYIMGILNVTPDSFSDGGDFADVEKAVAHAHIMVREGADIIDIGGESTRPGFEEISAEEELERVLPVLKRLIKEIDVPISVDTYKAEVAREVLSIGANIVNDQWGLKKDPSLAEVIAQWQVPAIFMHNQAGIEYQNDILEEIKLSLQESIDIALDAGVRKENIILDPGIGFGKNPEQNMVVMARLHELNELGYPILLGTSRKSMLGKILDLPPKDRIEGTVATTVMGIMQGIDIVRVHDIKENWRAAKVTDAIIRKH
ncbi:MAG: dihydropteroate synthase [Clostridiaceae bacterium BRH_c20a]|nr:MAG: dihydropteroate synthase [Clostridiaceae bacterium BRH_c20a]